ncbi:MAG: ATP-binding cassette domain-containing protein, partial [Flavobacteriales bacterium]|nr:ATP-binding cassette domain-containing protein [Flavobacteriales bacterium]
NIELSFERGKIYGIVGKNGAGKTTMFNCIAGLESFNGQLIPALTKKQISYGPTEPPIISKITGEEYLRFLTLSRDQNYSDFQEYNVFDLPLSRYAEHYSTGMKKKLLLTAVFLQKSEVLVLDEPFNGVDLESNLLIHEILKKFRQEQKTIILSSHIFSSLASLCDEIHYLVDGKIKFSGEQKDFNEIESEMRKDFLAEKVEVFSK